MAEWQCGGNRGRGSGKVMMLWLQLGGSGDDYMGYGSGMVVVE